MRKPYIDHIRSLTILLVVLYHVIYMFNHVATDGVIGPVTAFHGQDALQYLLYPWFMVILLLVVFLSNNADAGSPYSIQDAWLEGKLNNVADP